MTSTRTGHPRHIFDRVTNSTLNYRLVPLVDVAGAVVFLAAGLRSPLPPVSKAAAILAGLALWAPLEYGLHRWLGHGPPSAARRAHAMHHSDEEAPVAAPIFAVLSVITAIWIVLALLTTAGLASAFVGGVYAGYNYYTLVHHVLHHCEPLVLGLGGAGVMQRHRLHHARHDVNFGVTSTLCDRIFGTLSDPGSCAPADPQRRRSRGPKIPAPLRRARLWRA